MKVGVDAMELSAFVSNDRNGWSKVGVVLRTADLKKDLSSDSLMTEKPELVTAKARPSTLDTESKLVCNLLSATCSGSESRTVTSLATCRRSKCLASVSEASASVYDKEAMMVCKGGLLGAARVNGRWKQLLALPVSTESLKKPSPPALHGLTD